MSRIGKQPIIIPEGVVVKISDRQIDVTGPKGNLSLAIPAKIKVEVKDCQLLVSRLADDRQTRANHGTTRAHLNNLILGVVSPWKKELEIRGTGYKFALSGNQLIVTAGFIHPVNFPIPPALEFVVDQDTKLTITGPDKELVGQAASSIRQIRKPEPYKGKGIRYQGEFIKLKAGKTAKTE